MKRIAALTLALVMSLFLLTACGDKTSPNPDDPNSADKATLSLTCAHVMSEADPYHTGAQAFCDLVTEKTDGRITFTMFPNGQIGAERDITEGVSMGTVDVAIVTNAFCVNLAPEMGVLDFPYLFQSREEAYEILDGEIGDELFSYLEASNIKGLAYMENGFRNLNTRDKLISSPEEIKGMKIRTMETPVHLVAFNAAGANATPVSAAELFTALQQGTVKGQENPIKSIYDYKFYEVCPYITKTEHFYSSANLIMNLDVWNNLSDEDKAIFEECAVEATQIQRDACAERESECLRMMTDLGVQIEENVDKQAWAEAMHPVYEDANMIAQYGVYLDKITEALGRS